MESVDRNNRHIGSMSATLAMVPLLASLLLPGTAHAQEPDPVDTGSCYETEVDENGELLVSDSDVIDLWAEFGLDRTGVLPEVLKFLCESSKNPMKVITKPYPDRFWEKETEYPEPGDTQQGEISEENENTDSPPQSTPTPPASEGIESTVVPEDETTRWTPTGLPPGTGAQGGGPARATIDQVEGASPTPSTSERNDRGDAFTAQHHDNAQEAKAVERLPFLLAVIALAVVSAALTHTWARRKLLR